MLIITLSESRQKFKNCHLKLALDKVNTKYVIENTKI